MAGSGYILIFLVCGNISGSKIDRKFSYGILIIIGDIGNEED